MQNAFTWAVRNQPGELVESSYVFAGQIVNVSVVGRQLWERLNLPLKHLRVAERAAEPAPRIELWDSHDTRTDCPVSADDGAASHSPGFTVSESERFVGYRLPTSITCLDRAKQQIVGCVTRADRLSLYEAGRPLHVPLTIWHNDREVPVIHAGLVSLNGKGVLFAGSGGVGKSTSSLTCLLAGFDFLSDDLIALQTRKGGDLIGHSLYGSTFLDADHLERFPSLEPYAMTSLYPAEEKRMVLLSQIFSPRLMKATPISVVVLPRVVPDGRSMLRDASRAEALLALAPSSLLMFKIGSGISGFRKLAALVERVRCYRLDIGRDVNEIPARVEKLLVA